MHFRKVTDAEVCFVCDLPAESTPCPTVKIWEFHKDCTESRSLLVCHHGNHIRSVRKTQVPIQTGLLNAVIQNPSVTHGKLVKAKMANMMAPDDFM